MALTPGTRLGSYEVTAQIGAGGMGEVYRARDTKLDRDVAIKVLPESLAADPERIARFQREAKTLAALNDPHIAAIYGLEDAEGIKALVMELVEGPTLADRISQGAIPVDEALPIAKQIAGALEAAHEQGIIHRDLKPANIKVRPDGTVKVLDFGLAKALEPAGAASSSASMSPTITSPAMTQAGMLLGTAAYMSPEQAKGRPADKRSDAWSFGVVLYEMLTGRSLFGREDVSETLAAVLTHTPDLGALPISTPGSVRRLLARCLQRNRQRRLDSMAVVSLELDEREEALVMPPSSSARRGLAARERLAWGLLGIATIAALAMGLARSIARTPAGGPVLRSTIELPAAAADQNPGTRFAASPDGRRLAFVAPDAAGQMVLWVRPLDGPASQPLIGTEGAQAPFWSPDGQSIAFTAGGKLKRVEVSGGAPMILCDAAYAATGAWSGDVILFTPATNSGLFRVSSGGGVPVPVTSLDPAAAEARHSYPFFLPDGRQFLFLVTGGGGSALGVYVGSLDSEARTRVLEGGSNTVYAQGHVLYVRETRLVAQPFDLDRRAVSGDPVPLADEIPSEINSRAGGFSVSGAGLLFYQSGSSRVQLAWFDRSGSRLKDVGEPGTYGELALSPDGEYAAAGLLDSSGSLDTWLLDLERGLRTRFTFDPADDGFSVWAPDGKRIAFSNRRQGRLDIYVKAVGGDAAEQLLYGDTFDKFPEDWAPDGTHILYRTASPSTGADLWLLPLAGEMKPRAFVETPFHELGGRFSPDGRWVAFQTNRSGRNEVYVASFQDANLSRQISIAGGTNPRWHPGGREIFYLAGDTVMAAPVTGAGNDIKVGRVRTLFTVRRDRTRGSPYEVSPDGERFLVRVLEEPTSSLTVVVNWPGLLSR